MELARIPGKLHLWRADTGPPESRTSLQPTASCGCFRAQKSAAKLEFGQQLTLDDPVAGDHGSRLEVVLLNGALDRRSSTGPAEVGYCSPILLSTA